MARGTRGNTYGQSAPQMQQQTSKLEASQEANLVEEAIPVAGRPNVSPVDGRPEPLGPDATVPYEDLTLPSYYKDRYEVNGATTKILEKEFGYEEDYIELHIYDQLGTLLHSTENFTEYTGNDLDSQTNDSTQTFTEINLDLQNVLRLRGFTTGKYTVVLNIQRKKLFDSFEKPFSIKKISPSRRELKVVLDKIPNETLELLVRDFIAEMDSSVFFKDFVLNFGEDRIIPCINMGLNKRTRKYEVLIKCQEPLPAAYNIRDNFRIAEDITSRAVFVVDLGIPETPVTTANLRGPNFKIDTRLNNSIPSSFKNYDEILEYNVTSSYESLLNKLENVDIIGKSIDYDYIRPVSESFEGESLERPYHFENFVHFSSAVERLKNFQYKLKLIEIYDEQLRDLDDIPPPTNTTPFVRDSYNEIYNKKNKLIKSFDGYEYYLYFDSGSWASWPKTNLIYPYDLATVESVEAKTWLGSEDSSNEYYGGQLLSASLFDLQNKDNLSNTLPNFIVDNSQNDQYKLFTNMIGHHFDQIWVYIQHITEINDTHHVRGISKDLVYFVLKALGLDTFDQFENDNLIEYILGKSGDTSDVLGNAQIGDYTIEGDSINFYDTDFEGLTMVSASTAGSTAKRDISRNIWKRLYHNAPYLLKTKGTERGLRALMSCYGVPSTMLNVKEFGGATKDRTTYKTFSYDKSGLYLRGSTGTGAGGEAGGYFVKTPWSGHSDPDNGIEDGDPILGLSSSAKTVEFRIRPVHPGNTYQPYLLFALSSSNSINSYAPHLVLQPYTGADISASGDSDQFGTLKLFESTFVTSTEPFPIFNGETWNIFIGTPGTSGSNSHISFGAYKANFNKHTLKYTANSTNYASEAFRSETWGDPYFLNVNNGGAEWAYIGGMPPNSNANHEASTYIYSGSIQEVRYHFHQKGTYEMLSDHTLTQHALEPFMYSGNHPSASYNEVVLRLPLGSNQQKSSASFHPRIEVPYLGMENGVSSSFSPQEKFYYEETEIHHLPTPDTVGRTMTSEKVRIDSGSVDDDLLFLNLSSETSTLDRQPVDFPDLGVYFSPTNEINEDILYTLGSFRLDDYIGDPLPGVQTSSFYPDLKEIKDFYFKKVRHKRYNYWDYIKLIQYVDHTLFKVIEQWSPVRANTKTGLLIEPHYLERTKFPRHHIPTNDTGQTMVEGSYQHLRTDFDLLEENFMSGSAVIYTSNECRQGALWDCAEVGCLTLGYWELDNPHSFGFSRKDCGTNANIYVTTDYILNEVPNLDYNAEVCQAPITPYTGVKPEGYMAFKSDVLLGNATKGRKSSIYRRAHVRGKENDF
jgi:hypothetical protein